MMKKVDIQSNHFLARELDEIQAYKEWIDRCANRYMERAGLPREFALQTAQACFAELGGDLTGPDCPTPEESAEDDMDSWSDDGD